MTRYAPDSGRIAVLDAAEPVRDDVAGQVDNSHAGTTRFPLNLVIAGVAAGQQVAVGSVAVSSLGRSGRVTRLFDCGVVRGRGRTAIARPVCGRFERVATCSGIL